MTLEKTYNDTMDSYAINGYGKDHWQWIDEGRVYAIQDYLSSCEMTEDDWAFARREGIDDLCRELLEDD